MKYITSFLLFALIGMSCQSDKSNFSDEYEKALSDLSTNKDKNSASLFLKALRVEAGNTKDEKVRETLYIKGLSVAEEYKMGPAAIGFLMPLLKNADDAAIKEENIAKLASALSDIGKKVPADILINAYENNYPNGKYAAELKAKKTKNIDNIDTFLVSMAENIFVNPDKFGINKLNTQKYVDACEAYALGYSNNKMAPEYLYRAAEMARTLRTFPKALNIYDWIQDKYPNFEKAPTTLFLKGFMLENELRDKEAARKVYQEFTVKYPNSDLQDDVKFLLENIDKSDEEIMNIIEKK